MSTASSDIRNVAIIGHGGTGKTSLLEQALVQGGEVAKFAPVDGGKSVSDHAPEEIARGISVHTALGNLKWQGTKINLLDTPGSADFVGDVVAALHVADLAVVTVGADVGVQIETAKLWRRLEASGTPRVVFVNQMDKEHADFANVVADLREKLAGNFVPVVVPIGAGDGFAGVVDLISGKALSHTGGKESSGAVPEEEADAVEEYRLGLIEGAAEGDDALMEKYLEEETLSEEEVRSGLAASLKENVVVPGGGRRGNAQCGGRQPAGPDPAGGTVAAGGGRGVSGECRRGAVGVRVQDQPGPVLRQAVLDQGDERPADPGRGPGHDARRQEGAHHQAVHAAGRRPEGCAGAGRR